ncbi:hypothetical protein ACFQE6_33890, partial [Natrinema soli]
MHDERAIVRVTVGRGEPPSVARKSAGDDADETVHPLERGREVLRTARTAAETVDVLEVGSTGVRALEPLVLVTIEGRTAYYPRPSPAQTRTIVERAEAGSVEADDAEWVVEHASDAETL